MDRPLREPLPAATEWAKDPPDATKKTPGQGGNIERNGKWKTKPEEAETKGARLCSDKKIIPPTPLNREG